MKWRACANGTSPSAMACSPWPDGAVRYVPWSDMSPGPLEPNWHTLGSFLPMALAVGQVCARRLLVEASGNPDPATRAVDAFLAATLRGEGQAWPEGWSDIASLWQRIEFHGIALILAEIPDRLADWPQILREAIRSEAQSQVFWEESHMRVVANVLDGLAAHAIPARLMKGTALAYCVYDNPAKRRRGDTDLLVEAASLAATRGVLRDAGWTRRLDPHGLFFQETWLFATGFGMIHAIDLHWQPNDSPALQQVLRIAEYFSHSVPLTRLSAAARAPTHVLTFIQGAMNQAWHRAKGYFVGEERVIGGHRLIWSLDNHLLTRQFSEAEWAKLATIGTSREIAGIVLAALEAAERDLGTRAPREVLAALRAAPQDTALTRYLTQRSQLGEFLTDLRASEGLQAKAHFALANAFPARGHLYWKYPQATAWPVPLLHLRRLLEIALRSIGLRAS